MSLGCLAATEDSSANCDPTEDAFRTFDTIGRSPSNAAVNDWNGDGKADISTLCRETADISIMLGYGNGALTLSARLPVGGLPLHHTLVDVDRDGTMDILVADPSLGQLTLLLIDEKSNIKDRVDYAGPVGAQASAAGDFNGDGWDDAVVIGGSGGEVRVLLNSTTSSFDSTWSGMIQGASLRTVAVGRIDADSYLDIVVGADQSNQLYLFRGDGSGSFTYWKSLPASSSPRNVQLSDLDLDGYQDIIVCLSGSKRVAVWYGDAGDSHSMTAELATSGNPQGCSLVDLDSDGDLDIVVVNTLDNSINLFSQELPRDFVAQLPLGTINNPRAVQVGDFNSDCIPDIVTVGYLASAVAVHTAQSPGEFPVALDLPTGDYPYEIESADVNGDGHDDLLISCERDQTLRVHLRQVDGSLDPEIVTPLLEAAPTVIAADLDGDGVTDVIAHRDVYRGNNDGTFSFMSRLNVPNGSFAFANVLQLDSDVEQEIVVTAQFPSFTHVLDSAEPFIYSVAQSYLEARLPFRPACGDLNHDGFDDLVIPCTVDGRILVRLNDGSGGFAAPVEFSVASAHRALIGRFGTNPNPDIAVVGQSTHADIVSILEGDGAGNFALTQEYPAGDLPSDMTSGDLNGDGIEDLAVSNLGENSASVYLGNDKGTFDWWGDIGVGSRASAITVAGPGTSCGTLYVANDVSDRVTEIRLMKTNAAGVPPSIDRTRPPSIRASLTSDKSGLLVDLASAKAGQMRFDLFSVDGRRVAELGSASVSAGSSSVQITPECGRCLARLSRGVYLLLGTQSDILVSCRLVVL